VHGDWELFLPYETNKNTFIHGSKVKVTIHSANGIIDRIPAWIRKVIQDPATHDFSGQLWFPDSPYEWTDNHFNLAQNIQQPIIYECHVGMALEAEKVGSYKEFADDILTQDKGRWIQCHPADGHYGTPLLRIIRIPCF
jgi:1,4-alpha-glucan branching enzyme